MKPFARVECDNDPDRAEYDVVFDELIFGQALGTHHMSVDSAEVMANHFNKIYRARVREELIEFRKLAAQRVDQALDSPHYGGAFLHGRETVEAIDIDAFMDREDKDAKGN